MNTIQIDPRKLIIPWCGPADFSYIQMIQEDGLPTYDGATPTIMACTEGEGYRVAKGGKYVRAVLALIDEDAECFDPRGGQTGKSGEIYRTVPVRILG